MQPTEQETSDILVAFIDRSYPAWDDDAWRIENAHQRTVLEGEIGQKVEPGNISGGADLPAFLTFLQTATVPAWLLVASAFFAGKSIGENLSAWREIWIRLRNLVRQRVRLNRNGAAVIAVNAVFDALGSPPASIRLLGYQAQHVADDAAPSSTQRLGEIEQSLPTVSLADYKHIFDIEADGSVFRVVVDGREYEIVRLPKTSV